MASAGAGAAFALCVIDTACCSSTANTSPSGNSLRNESPTSENCSVRPARRCISPLAIADQASLAEATRFLACAMSAGSKRPSTLCE
jgi:hypothetical protein